MKTILAPVDFSDASINALWFAAELCKRAAARLLVATVVQKEQNESNAIAVLNDTATNVRSAFGPTLKVDSIAIAGELVPAVQQLVAEHHPDLIVMGTKGASGLKEILIGSNTVNVMAKVTVPLLVIPELARFEGFLNRPQNQIVLATDLDEIENEAALDLLKEVALLVNNPNVKVVSVRPKNTELDYIKKLQRDALLGLFSPEIESERVTVFSNNVMSGLNYYLEKDPETSLVAMIARDSGHLIQRHYTREMASHTHLPLLVLHDFKH